MTRHPSDDRDDALHAQLLRHARPAFPADFTRRVLDAQRRQRMGAARLRLALVGLGLAGAGACVAMALPALASAPLHQLVDGLMASHLPSVLLALALSAAVGRRRTA